MELRLGSFSLFILGIVMLGAGVAGGVAVERYALLKCAVEQKEFNARTVVCEDGEVYKLVNEASERAVTDRLTSRVEKLEAVIRPAEETKR